MMPRRACGRIDHDAVELVGAGEGRDGRHLRPVQAPLLLERRVGPADVEAARRQLEILRHDDLDRGRDRRWTEAELSTVSAIALKPTQQPEKRDSAKPSKPKSRYSCTVAGLSTGIIAAAKICSL